MQLRTSWLTRNWRQAGAALLLACCLSLITTGTSSAVSNVSPVRGAGYSITMTPPSTQLQAPPGGSTNGSFTVINEGNVGYNMALSVAPYYVVSDSYQPKFTLLPGKTDASAWIHLSGPTTQYLKAGLPLNIGYSLTVPPGTAPGGYYTVIFAETEPPASKGGVTAHNRVGNILYITVAGPVVKQGSVTGTHLPRLVLGSSLPIGLLVKDTGGLHFLTTASIAATNEFGSHIAYKAQLQRYVLPQTERVVSTTWSAVPLVGVYKIDRSATVFGHRQSLPSQTVIIIRPWLLIIIVLLIIAVLTLLVQPVLKRKRRVRKHGKTQQLGKRQ